MSYADKLMTEFKQICRENEIKEKQIKEDNRRAVKVRRAIEEFNKLKLDQEWI